MITKQKLPTMKSNKVLTTFVMPAIDDCACLYLVGKFGDWGESVYRMQRTDDGTWSLSLELEGDCEFQYRYRTDKGDWLDDFATGELEGSKNSTRHM